MTNVVDIRPPAAAAPAVEAEPLEDAVRELSACIACNSDERRRLFSRLDELRGHSPSLRRRRARRLTPEPMRPVTFYSIEEAEAEEAAAPRQVA